MTRPTAFSLPGMVREEKITRSPLPRVTSGCSSWAMRDERRARLALAAGAQRHHLVGRQVAVGIGAAKLLDAVEIAGLAGDLGDAVHGAADHHHLAAAGAAPRPRPPACAPRWRRRSSPRRGRALLAINSLSDFATSRFGRRAPFAHRIGGIPDHGEAAGVAERPQLGLVGRRADQRGRIELPVAGVEHRAERGADDEGVGLRDRMGDRDELDVERRQA